MDGANKIECVTHEEEVQGAAAVAALLDMVPSEGYKREHKALALAGKKYSLLGYDHEGYAADGDSGPVVVAAAADPLLRS
jgi:hypothetical protein